MSQYEFETEKWVENSVKCRFKVVKEANLEFCQIKLGFFFLFDFFAGLQNLLSDH